MGAVRLFFHGQLQIRAYGRDPERFLNLCAGTGVTLYNMKRKEDDVCFVLSVPDFRRAVPLAREEPHVPTYLPSVWPSISSVSEPHKKSLRCRSASGHFSAVFSESFSVGHPFCRESLLYG